MSKMSYLGRHTRRAIRRRDREELRLDRILWGFVAFLICAGVFAVSLLLVALLARV